MVDYIKGSKKEFYEFVDLITPRDKVAIISHIDLDGLSSAIFLEKILEAKGISVEYVDFLQIQNDIVKKLSFKLKEKEIIKVFFCDLNIDSVDLEGYYDLKKEMDVFLVDHHPMNELVKDWKNIIKTNSDDCSSMTLFDLGQGILDKEEWEWLNCAAMFSDYSHKDFSNFEYIQSIYPEINKENISSFIPGINARKISSALIYYRDNLEYVYELVKSRNLERLTEIHEIIENEVERIINDFAENKKYYKSKKLYFYELSSNYAVTSYVISLISKLDPENIFVFVQNEGDRVKISARYQGDKINLGILLKQATENFEDANGGGHAASAGGSIQIKDLKEFKRKLLDLL